MDESLRWERNRWAGARVPVWWVPGQHKPAAGELAEDKRSGLNKSDLHVFLIIAGGHSS